MYVCMYVCMYICIYVCRSREPGRDGAPVVVECHPDDVVVRRVDVDLVVITIIIIIFIINDIN